MRIVEFRRVHSELPHFGLATEVLHRGAIAKGKIDRGRRHADREETEERGEGESENPVNGSFMAFSQALGNKERHENEDENTVKRGVSYKLDEKLEARFRDNPTDPK